MNSVANLKGLNSEYKFGKYLLNDRLKENPNTPPAIENFVTYPYKEK